MPSQNTDVLKFLIGIIGSLLVILQSIIIYIVARRDRTTDELIRNKNESNSRLDKIETKFDNLKETCYKNHDKKK